jgi:WbqC-like protein family
MKAAIHQPNFLPWVGFFNKIKSVDLFIFFDDVQFERGKTYTSRTKILIQGNETWLTIPVTNKSSLILIKDIEVVTDTNWKSKHLKCLSLNYKKAPYFEEIFQIIEKTYRVNSRYLIDFNIPLIKDICQYLKVSTELKLSSELDIANAKAGDKILSLLKSVNANEYLSGSGMGSKRYINDKEFELAEIKLSWQEFIQTPYHQYGAQNFVSNLSVIDLLFNMGKDSCQII